MTFDHQLPRYHLRPPRGYVNDPNGPVYVDGRWHLYFQYVSDTPRRGAVVWGHASSADLVTWRYHRPALSPEPGGIDRDGCWSGNTVLSDGAVVAFYSGFRREHPYQSVLSAVSTDGGLSFGPARAVVADPEPAEQVREFRDPFVWREADRWLMVVGAGGTTTGSASARLYESADLTTWSYLGPLVEMVGTTDRSDPLVPDTGDMWECPQLLSFGDRDVLLIGVYNLGGGTPRVLSVIGPRQENRIGELVVAPYDRGANFYAASAMRDSPAGPLVWGWVTEGRSADWTVEADWSGMLSLPRSVDLTDDGRLISRPVAALTALREDALQPAPSPAPSTVVYEGLPGQFEVELVGAAARGDDAAPTRMSLRCGTDEHLDLVLDWANGRVSLDRDSASRDPRAHGGVYAWNEPMVRTSDGLGIRWFVDGSVSELFTSTGQCSTLRFYPTTPPPWRLEITGLDTGDKVQAWPISPCSQSASAGP